LGSFPEPLFLTWQHLQGLFFLPTGLTRFLVGTFYVVGSPQPRRESCFFFVLPPVFCLVVHFPLPCRIENPLAFIGRPGLVWHRAPRLSHPNLFPVTLQRLLLGHRFFLGARSRIVPYLPSVREPSCVFSSGICPFGFFLGRNPEEVTTPSHFFFPPVLFP